MRAEIADRYKSSVEYRLLTEASWRCRVQASALANLRKDHITEVAITTLPEPLWSCWVGKIPSIFWSPPQMGMSQSLLALFAHRSLSHRLMNAPAKAQAALLVKTSKDAPTALEPAPGCTHFTTACWLRNGRCAVPVKSPPQTRRDAAPSSLCYSLIDAASGSVVASAWHPLGTSCCLSFQKGS